MKEGQQELRLWDHTAAGGEGQWEDGGRGGHREGIRGPVRRRSKGDALEEAVECDVEVDGSKAEVGGAGRRVGGWWRLVATSYPNRM